MSSPTMRHAYQLTFSVRLIAEVARDYQEVQDSGSWVEHACMLDAFFVHVRLLAEFLVKPTKSMDFGPSVFVSNWRPVASESLVKLDQYWTTASKFVVHFAHERVPTDVAELQVFDPSVANIRLMAADVLDVFDSFVSAVELEVAEGGEWVEAKRAILLRRELDAALALRT